MIAAVAGWVATGRRVRLEAGRRSRGFLGWGKDGGGDGGGCGGTRR